MAASTQRRRPKRRVMNEINVVPYIDVMLVLLVIFMVTAPMMTPGVVNLPSVGKAANTPESVVEIIVSETEQYRVRVRNYQGSQKKGRVAEEQTLSKSDLIQFIKGLQADNESLPVVISADKKVAYEKVVNILDDLQKQNVKRVGLMVQSGKK